MIEMPFNGSRQCDGLDKFERRSFFGLDFYA
jgi:hypothetical protein